MSNGSSNNLRFKSRIYALYLFGGFGITSVLLDLDHVITLVQKEIPINAQNLISNAARPLHLPVFFFLGIACLYFAASIYRLRNSSL